MRLAEPGGTFGGGFKHKKPLNEKPITKKAKFDHLLHNKSGLEIATMQCQSASFISLSPVEMKDAL